MKIRVFIAIIAFVLLNHITVNADFVGVTAVLGPFQHPDKEIVTARYIAQFTDPNDRISAVSGNAIHSINFSMLRGVMYNQPMFNGDPINDFPSTSLGGEPWDSYVTIGATDFPHNVMFTPGFQGESNDPPDTSVIQSCRIIEEDGAWFYFGAPPTVGQFDSIPDNETIDVVIAQFTVNSDAGIDLWFSGNLSWISAAGGANQSQFAYGNLFMFSLADLNLDHSINTQDLLELLSAWGPTDYETGKEFCPTPPDFNDDGVVDVYDLEFLLDNWFICDA